MTLSILAKGAKAPVHAPVFGHLVHTDNMNLCVRATSSQNFFDLSDDERSLSATESSNMIITQNGIEIYGGAGNGGIVPDGLFATDFDDFTIMAVVSATAKSGSAQPLNVWAVGDFYSTAIYTGLGLFLRTSFDSVNSVWTASVRGGFGGRNKTTNANGGSFVDTVFNSNIGTGATPPAFDYPAMFIVARQKIVGSTAQLDVKIVSHSKQTSTVNTAIDLSGAAKAAVQASGSYANKPLKIGGSYSTASDSTDHKIKIKEVRFDSVALTDQQIQDQYQATKKWLQSEGVLDISYWS